jgi:hypothetical protein
MSSAARRPSGFFKNQYDHLALLVGLLALIASAVLLLIKTGDAGRKVTAAELRAVNPRPVEALDAAPLDELEKAVAEPFQLSEAQQRLLVSADIRISSVPDGLPIPFDAEVCPYTGTAQPVMVRQEERDSDGDGLPDGWETTYGLNPLNPSDAAGDLDGDGFSNLEEFEAGSNPVDAASFPPPSAKLRLARSQVNPFKLLFRGTSLLPNGDTKYQINLRSLERTYFAAMNEEVEGFLIEDFLPETPDGPTLVLKQGDKTINLVQGRVRDETAYSAILVFLVDGQVMRKNIGDDIQLLDKAYKVVDIQQNRVVIRDEATGEDVDIGMLSMEERQILSKGQQ